MIGQKKLKALLFDKIQKIYGLHDKFSLYLFGSYAWGKPDTGSDIDLLLVSADDKNPHLFVKELYKSFADIEQDIDILGYKKTAIQKKSKNNKFFKRILTKGEVVYGKGI